jgi:hypothetical protein
MSRVTTWILTTLYARPPTGIDAGKALTDDSAARGE